MNPWSIVALLGAGLTLWGLVETFRRYREGAVSLRFVLAVVVGLASFGSFAVASAIRPDLDGLATVAILLPAFVAIVVVARERGMDH